MEIPFFLLLVASFASVCMCRSVTPAPFTVQVLPDGSEEYKVSISSRNVTLMHDYVFICASVEVPFGSEETYITKVEPKPIPGMHYHMILHVCDESGYKGRGGPSPSWDCGEDYFAPPNPPLDRAYGCILDGKPSLGSFLYQYQAGPPDEAALILPKNTGVPVGGGPGHKQTLVIGYHFPHIDQTIDGTSGVTEVDITLKRKMPNVKKVGSINLAAYGFLAANSVSSITASWTLDQKETEIQVIRLYTHWHDLVVSVKVRIVRPDGAEDLLLQQDPKSYWGVSPVPESESSIMRFGDRLTIECTYNITMTHNVRVEDREMCSLYAFYSTTGKETLADIAVSSYDSAFHKCFNYRQNLEIKVNDDAVGSFRGPVSDKECFVSGFYGLGNATDSGM